MNSNTPSPQSIRICPITPDEQSAALELLFSTLTPEARNRQIESILSLLASDALSREGLLGAFRNGKLVGSIFAQQLPGKNAQIWLPNVVQDDNCCTAKALLQATVEWLDKCQICMAQMLLETVNADEEALLREGGFDYLTDLLYLACLEDNFPTHPVPTVLEFETYNQRNHDRFERIVDATYQETLDSPKLNNVRRIEDVLEGYRTTGVFSPSRWLIVRYKDQDVGCLLLADHQQYENMELVYMGITPSVRGHRWGTDIVRYAQWMAKQTHRRRLVLAVDASNQPAINMYASVGFRTWDQRRIYYRIFSR
jgi:mycothiol synthase